MDSDAHRRIIALGDAPKDGIPRIVTITGAHGVGKTHMGTWLFSRWYHRMLYWYRRAQEDGDYTLYEPQVLYITGRMAAERFKDFSNDSFSWQREYRDLTRAQLRIVMIDDLFADRKTETDIANMTELVEGRRNAGLLTIITSNTDVPSMPPRLGERLIDECVIHIPGTSHRGGGVWG